MSCKGLCELFRTQSISSGRFHCLSGQKRRQCCGIFLRIDGNVCQCCHYKLRLSRPSRLKKRFIQAMESAHRHDISDGFN